ncbi:MAG TPA: HAMP domain-containing sensor histidine kinase [Chryseosolibacter sp.]
MRKKNAFVIALMCSSMVLLLVLQFFWIKGAYQNAEDNFRKETNLLFRNTIFTMHDTLLQRSLTPVAGDTSGPKIMVKRAEGRRKEVLALRQAVPDSLDSFIKVTEKTAQIEIYSSVKSDSIGKMLRPLVTKMQLDKEPKRFVFHFAVDTLSKDSIRSNFHRALEKAGIDSEFEILKVGGPRILRDEDEMPLRGKFVSDVVPFSPITQYAVRFSEAPTLLWKEITPQILFAVFLTLLTGVSFTAMYRNLRSQQRLMDIKNDFISNVTHELKTPVATVSVALEALKNFNALQDPQKTKEYLDIAQRELNRLTLMTDKILKTSVYEDQGVTIKHETIQLDTLIDQILLSMKLVFEKKGTELRFEKTGTDFTMSGSVEHMTNVLYNLVDNALKYGAEESRITITLESTAGELILKVKDSGIGIPKEYHQKIFEKFFRVPSGDVHTVKGYGLGLSYVASVIEGHGGNISVESEPGKGSCFTIRLPKQNNAA